MTQKMCLLGVIKILTLKPSKFDTEMDLEIFDWKILSTGMPENK